MEFHIPNEKFEVSSNTDTFNTLSILFLLGPAKANFG